jgi:hypothetical protein
MATRNRDHGAARSASPIMALGLLILVLAGCSTTGSQRPHGPDRTVRRAPVRRGLHPLPHKEGPVLAGSREGKAGTASMTPEGVATAPLENHAPTP